MQLKMFIESYKRIYGYYIIDLIDIRPLKQRGIEGERLLNILFSEWDRPRVPAKYLPPEEASWLDCRADLKDAIDSTISVLKGGYAIGHSVDTIPHEVAESSVYKFMKLFSNPTSYSGMGLGSQDYVFQQGIVLIDENIAGILWVVEND